MRALLVEDDAEVASALADGLQRYGWQVDHVSTGAMALRSRAGSDVILLDLNLPDMDGLELCRSLRNASQVPIIAVTARSSEMDQVICLRLGADDYVVKPYRLQELLARMAAVTRRSAAPAAGAVDHVIRRGRITIDRAQHKVLVDGAEVQLTLKEFALLNLLAERPGWVYSRQQLLEAVWDQKWAGESRTLDTHVAALRRKLGAAGRIRTTRGVGFSFESVTGK
ncbi:response regulator transcription factor [Streptomyces sp. TP-A0874]|uniref:response regulator transcription factor n=1 Tax=Streptomyces sp. TP-A0874 TaxID=549819 RepID=UPI000852BEB2|nr:response regulator transcription factor [Streptomyces sp. TP-A0874]